MKNLTVELQLDSKLDIPDTHDSRDINTVRALLDKIHLNVVNFIRYTEEGENYDTNGPENNRTLYNDETIVYVHLAVEPENESFYNDGYNLIKYVGDALDFRPAKVTKYHERKEGSFSITFIDITVSEVVDGVEIVN